MLNPAHPGELIRDEVLPSYGLSVAAAARVLKMPRPNLHNVLNTKANVTPAIALKIEAAFGVSAELLANMQSQWDLAQARKLGDQLTAGIERQVLAPTAS